MRKHTVVVVAVAALLSITACAPGGQTTQVDDDDPYDASLPLGDLPRDLAVRATSWFSGARAGALAHGSVLSAGKKLRPCGGRCGSIAAVLYYEPTAATSSASWMRYS